MTEVKKNPAEEKSTNSYLVFYIVVIALSCIVAAQEFILQTKPEPIRPSRYLTKQQKLSDYLPTLRNTRGDTDIYVFEGKEPGGTAVILGGTHPNEPAAYLTSILIIENIQVHVGKLIVIPRANASAFTTTEPQEAYPSIFRLENRTGETRSFRVGSRYSNLLDGWPDPIVYRHHPSGQLLSGAETRNLNRSYPGRKNGILTERIAWAITELVKQENANVVIDFHEAAPEYPVVNAIVAHDNAVDVAAMSVVDLQVRDVELRFEISPHNFHGLIHREVGDRTDAHVYLLETAGALQGRLRGITNENLILNSVDHVYTKAYDIGKLHVPFPAEGIPLWERAGRHLESFIVIMSNHSLFYPEETISFSKVPGLTQLRERGISPFLN